MSDLISTRREGNKLSGGRWSTGETEKTKEDTSSQLFILFMLSCLPLQKNIDKLH